jgi:hypothetical protein
VSREEVKVRIIIRDEIDEKTDTIWTCSSDGRFPLTMRSIGMESSMALEKR